MAGAQDGSSPLKNCEEQGCLKEVGKSVNSRKEAELIVGVKEEEGGGCVIGGVATLALPMTQPTPQARFRSVDSFCALSQRHCAASFAVLDYPSAACPDGA